MAIATAYAYPTAFGLYMQLPPRYLKRNFARFLKMAVLRMPRAWQLQFLPKHFNAGAEVTYQYKKRSTAYLRKKQKAKGHSRPLVWSWRTKNKLMALPPIIAGSAKRVTGSFRAPWYIQMIPKTRNAPSMGKELMATTRLEGESLLWQMTKHAEELLQAAAPKSAKRQKWRM